MTTNPSDMKPSDRIRELAGKNGGSVIHATVQYLDEQHAAGHRESEPVLAPDEAAWADYRARSAPVAEPPAQPVAAAPAYRVDIALLRQAAERCRDAKPDGHELLDALRHLQGCFGWQTVLGLLAQLGAAESKLDAIEGAACVAAEPAVLVAGEAPTGAALLWKMFGNRMGDERYCHMLDGAEARSIVDERAKLAHERYEALLQVEKLTKELDKAGHVAAKWAAQYDQQQCALTASNERAERLEKGCDALRALNAALAKQKQCTQCLGLIAEPPPVATGERPAPAAQMWFYAPSRDSDSWEGPHDTLDDALEAARSDYTGSRESFWVDEAHPVDWEKVQRQFADAEDLLERFGEYVGDNEHIEDPEPEFRVSKDAAQEALERWAVEHLSMRDYWQCIGKAVVYPVAPPPTPATGGEGEA